jgi:SAM-dependent methyltransferase
MDPEAYVEMAEVQDSHWWFRGRREILRSVITGLALPGSPQILEIGAGTGGNLTMLSQFGSVKALEIDDYARSIARQRTNDRVDIRQGHLPDGIPFSDKFDLVCLFDVLEHVELDLASLKAIRRIVSSNGCLLLTVPAYSWLWSAHDERLHHVRRYTASGLTEKAQLAGWAVRRITYFNTLLFPLAVAARVTDKIFPGRQPSGTGIPAPVVNSALYRVFSMEKTLLRAFNFPFGVSLMAQLYPH